MPVPLGLDKRSGLPIGIQFTPGFGCDEDLLQIAA